MRGWTDLSWTEKRKIEDGEVSSLKYSTGYSFGVKSKVREGIENKEQKEKITKNNSKK